MTGKIAILAVFLMFTSTVLSYKPVIIVHGILDHASDLNDLANLIRSAHPDTNITLINIFEELKSFEPLWKQIDGYIAKARPVMEQAHDGVHIIGFSQGGLVVRGMLETMSDHNVVNFISLSAPQNGQYGDSSYLKPYLPAKAVKDVYKFFYTYIAQKTFSLANYWQDPYHQKENLERNVFLPVINNNRSSKFRNEQEYEKQKKNFLKIKNLVLIGGPDDGVISPWESSQFGSYEENSNVRVKTMIEQEFFLEDSFGLKTLYDSNRIHMYNFSKVQHVHWHGNKQVFEKAIEPWLT